MKITILLFFHLHFSKCETCCSVKELVSTTNPSASGRYVLVGHSSTLKTINSRCSSGCVYVKQGDSSDTQFCFQPSQQGTSACAENCQNSLPIPSPAPSPAQIPSPTQIPPDSTGTLLETLILFRIVYVFY